MVDNSGGIDATSGYWATAIDVRGFGDATVENSGSMYANGVTRPVRPTLTRMSRSLVCASSGGYL